MRPPPGEGWRAPPFALDVGQVEDWVRSLPPGGGREHWQAWPDGRTATHRDRYDPARGPAEAVAHVLVETPTGAILATVLLVALLVAARKP